MRVGPGGQGEGEARAPGAVRRLQRAAVVAGDPPGDCQSEARPGRLGGGERHESANEPDPDDSQVGLPRGVTPRSLFFHADATSAGMEIPATSGQMSRPWTPSVTPPAEPTVESSPAGRQSPSPPKPRQPPNSSLSERPQDRRNRPTASPDQSAELARPQPLQLEEVCLSELISDCSIELQPVFQDLRVNLDLVNENESLSVGADERMLRQTVLNLMRNAAESISEESADRLVTVTTKQDRDANGKLTAVIEVKDSGPGIAAAHLQKIFIPFFTTKAKGHGVGLALSHRVITEHGGTLTAENSPDGGAVFTIRLPN